MHKALLEDAVFVGCSNNGKGIPLQQHRNRFVVEQLPDATIPVLFCYVGSLEVEQLFNFLTAFGQQGLHTQTEVEKLLANLHWLTEG